MTEIINEKTTTRLVRNNSNSSSSGLVIRRKMVRFVITGRIWMIMGMAVGFSISMIQHAQLNRVIDEQQQRDKNISLHHHHHHYYSNSNNNNNNPSLSQSQSLAQQQRVGSSSSSSSSLIQNPPLTTTTTTASTSTSSLQQQQQQQQQQQAAMAGEAEYELADEEEDGDEEEEDGFIPVFGPYHNALKARTTWFETVPVVDAAMEHDEEKAEEEISSSLNKEYEGEDDEEGSAHHKNTNVHKVAAAAYGGGILTVSGKRRILKRMQLMPSPNDPARITMLVETLQDETTTTQLQLQQQQQQGDGSLEDNTVEEEEETTASDAANDVKDTDDDDLIRREAVDEATTTTGAASNLPPPPESQGGGTLSSLLLAPKASPNTHPDIGTTTTTTTTTTMNQAVTPTKGSSSSSSATTATPLVYATLPEVPLKHRAKPPDKDVLVSDTDDSFPLEEILPLDHLDETFDPHRLVFYNEKAMERDRRLYETNNAIILPAVRFLLRLANHSLEQGPWSVMDKPTDSVAPSNNLHDYYHPAPYFWPPLNADGTVNPHGRYVWRDGQRVPGTILYGPMSERFDRTRLAAMQYNTTVLSLSYYMTRDPVYAQKAAHNVQTWFLNPTTRMNPNLSFSQIRRNHIYKEGAKSGVIEMKDVYFFLDSIRILERFGFLNDQEQKELRDWFRSYLEWLKTSRQGRLERQTLNNHGLYYDIQIVSIAAYVNDLETLKFYLNWSLDRLDAHIDEDGALIHELNRKTCEHYQMFTLQGWSTMARITLSVASISLWDSYPLSNGGQQQEEEEAEEEKGISGLCRAAEYSIPYFRERSVCPQNVQRENYRRWWPLLHEARYYCPNLQPREMVWNDWISVRNQVPITSYKMPSLFNPHDGIPPFWNLGAPHGAAVFSINRSANQTISHTTTAEEEEDAAAATGASMTSRKLSTVESTANDHGNQPPQPQQDLRQLVDHLLKQDTPPVYNNNNNHNNIHGMGAAVAGGHRDMRAVAKVHNERQQKQQQQQLRQRGR